MTKLYKLQELSFSYEDTFMDGAGNVTALTYVTRIPFLTATCTMEQPRETDQTVQNRKNVTRPGFLGLRTGTLEFTTYWPGHMTDPGGGSALGNWFSGLLAAGLGGSDGGTDDGGTVDTPTNAHQFSVTGVSDLTKGTIIRVGDKNDGHGEGQPVVIGAKSGATVTTLMDLPNAPLAADDVRCTAVRFPTETGPSSYVRFLMGFTETGAQFHAMGCQLESLRFEIDIAGGRPARVTFRYRMAWWERGEKSIPSGTTLENTDTAVIAGGSFLVQAVGTTTRALEECGALTLNLAMGLVPQQGPTDFQQNYTNMTGWVSTGCIPSVTWSIPYSTQPATDFDSDGSSSTFKYCLFNANGTHGRTYGFFMPNMFPIGAKPTYTDRNGLLYVTKTFQGTESSDDTSDLTLSPIRFFQG
jgi:hypothetical protein